MDLGNFCTKKKNVFPVLCKWTHKQHISSCNREGMLFLRQKNLKLSTLAGYFENCLTAGGGLNDPMSLQTQWNILQNVSLYKRILHNIVVYCAPTIPNHSGCTCMTWSSLFFNKSLLVGEKMKMKSSSHQWPLCI